jgi:putative salt-induced outer membrane protein YdiY
MVAMSLRLVLLVAASGLVAQQAPAPVAEPAAEPSGWSYEADLDLGGRSGREDGTSLSAGVRAEHEVKSVDKTVASLRGNSTTTGAEKSADDLLAKGSYEHTLAKSTFWYVRADAGYDRVRDLDLVALGTGGLGYRILEDDKGSFDVRAGLGYRVEETDGAGMEDTRAAALDLGLALERDLAWGKLRVGVDAVPSLEDLADLTIRHESSFEFLLKDSPLALRVGITQDYRSEDPDEKLQNTYFLRLVYRWR